MFNWMRWFHTAGLLLALVMAVVLCRTVAKQEARIDMLMSDMEQINLHLPGLIRSELSAQEERIVIRIEALLVKR